MFNFTLLTAVGLVISTSAWAEDPIKNYSQAKKAFESATQATTFYDFNSAFYQPGVTTFNTIPDPEVRTAESCDVFTDELLQQYGVASYGITHTWNIRDLKNNSQTLVSEAHESSRDMSRDVDLGSLTWNEIYERDLVLGQLANREYFGSSGLINIFQTTQTTDGLQLYIPKNDRGVYSDVGNDLSITFKKDQNYLYGKLAYRETGWDRSYIVCKKAPFYRSNCNFTHNSVYGIWYGAPTVEVEPAHASKLDEARSQLVKNVAKAYRKASAYLAVAKSKCERIRDAYKRQDCLERLGTPDVLKNYYDLNNAQNFVKCEDVPNGQEW